MYNMFSCIDVNRFNWIWVLVLLKLMSKTECAGPVRMSMPSACLRETGEARKQCAAGEKKQWMGRLSPILRQLNYNDIEFITYGAGFNRVTGNVTNSWYSLLRTGDIDMYHNLAAVAPLKYDGTTMLYPIYTTRVFAYTNKNFWRRRQNTAFSFVFHPLNTEIWIMFALLFAFVLLLQELLRAGVPKACFPSEPVITANDLTSNSNLNLNGLKIAHRKFPELYENLVGLVFAAFVCFYEARLCSQVTAPALAETPSVAAIGVKLRRGQLKLMVTEILYDFIVNNTMQDIVMLSSSLERNRPEIFLQPYNRTEIMHRACKRVASDTSSQQYVYIELEDNMDEMCAAYLCRMQALELQGFGTNFATYVVSPQNTNLRRLLNYEIMTGMVLIQDKKENSGKFCNSTDTMAAYVVMGDLVDACYVYAIGLGCAAIMLIGENLYHSFQLQTKHQ